MTIEDAKLLRAGDRVLILTETAPALNEARGIDTWITVESVSKNGDTVSGIPDRLDGVYRWHSIFACFDPKILEGRKPKEPPKMPPLWIRINRATHQCSYASESTFGATDGERLVRIPGEGEPVARITLDTLLVVHFNDGLRASLTIRELYHCSGNARIDHIDILPEVTL